MSALCQKRTFRLLLDIIVGGQGCSSSWSITRETSPPKAISVFRRGRRRAAVHVVLCLGAGLSNAAGTHYRRLCPRWCHRHHGTPRGSMAVGAARPAIRRRAAGTSALHVEIDDAILE